MKIEWEPLVLRVQWDLLLPDESKGRGVFGVERQIIYPNDLDELGKVRLTHELIPLTASGFMRDVSSDAAYEAMFLDVYNHVVGAQSLSVHRGVDTNPVAFVASGIKSYRDLRVYHLEGIILAPDFQGNGFAQRILKEELVENRANVLAFHTQSICMERLGLKVSDYDSDLAKDISTLIGTGNCIDTLHGPVDKGRYGGSSLYGDIEAFDSIAINRPSFNYLDGDAIVFAGYVR